jgi:hypothetical protein
MLFKKQEDQDPNAARLFCRTHLYTLIGIWIVWLLTAATHYVFSFARFLPHKVMAIFLVLFAPVFGPFTGPLLGGWNTWGGSSVVSQLPQVCGIAAILFVPQLIKARLGTLWYYSKLILWTLFLIFWSFMAFISILLQMD